MVDIEDVAHDVVDTAIKVHMALGPGLLESAYRECHAFELRKRGRTVLTEVKLPLIYEGNTIEVGYRLDELVDNLIIVENKVVENLLPVHHAQLMTYMKLSGKQIGFLLNWNVRRMKEGIRRVVYNLSTPSPYPSGKSSLPPSQN
jgi:GxxExxY protein